ncbi:MAG TPA: phage major capsid protein, partial [Phycisphaerae bacterium]|nr:phage major capsid protein [Phycisphaerae bacterium]
MVQVDEKMIQELNDLVRGATENSEKAITELRGVCEGFDERLVATEQYRKDIDVLAQDLRKFSKQILDRTFAAGRSNYRGNFNSAEEARIFGLAVMGYCCGMGWARQKLADEDVEITKAMGEGTEGGGGFAVPEGALGSLIRLIEVYGAFRRNVLVVPMSRDHQPWPKRAAGLTVYCPGEGAGITASDVTLGLVAMTAKKWCTLTAISSELEEDAAIAIAELVFDEIALAFGIKEDSCGFVGDGTSTYFG